MKLQQQVCSLEYAKKLKELGVKQESLWYWHGEVEPEIKHTHNFSWIDNITYSAFTVAELMEIMPFCIQSKQYGCPFFLRLAKANDGKYSIMFWQHNPWFHPSEDCGKDCGHALAVIYMDNPANCLAQMLNILIENAEKEWEDIKL